MKNYLPMQRPTYRQSKSYLECPYLGLALDQPERQWLKNESFFYSKIIVGMNCILNVLLVHHMIKFISNSLTLHFFTDFEIHHRLYLRLQSMIYCLEYCIFIFSRILFFFSLIYLAYSSKFTKKMFMLLKLWILTADASSEFAYLKNFIFFPQ